MKDSYLVFISLACSMLALVITLKLMSDHFAWTKSSKKRRAFVKFRTAVHEAGHAMTVLKSSRADCTLHVVTTVPDTDSGGMVRFSLTGLPAFVQWEQVIIALGGAAGEYVAQGEIDNHSCSKDFSDALQYAEKIAESHSVVDVRPQVDLAPRYPTGTPKSAMNVLNFCFNEAHRRVKENQRDFFRLVNDLLERRELTGTQVVQLLSSKDN